MAWTSPRTWVAGEVVTAALLNTHLKDNLLQTAPGLVTTSGDIVVASGANALARQAAMTQAQAEAGSDTTVRGITAQRLSQAVAALGEASDYQEFTGNGTWTKPSGTFRKIVIVEAIGAGGSGGGGTAAGGIGMVKVWY